MGGDRAGKPTATGQDGWAGPAKLEAPRDTRGLHRRAKGLRGKGGLIRVGRVLTRRYQNWTRSNYSRPHQPTQPTHTPSIKIPVVPVEHPTMQVLGLNYYA